MKFKGIYLIIIIIVIALIYYSWDNKEKKLQFENQYDLVSKYFFKNEKSLEKVDKPILWVHIKYDFNARKWDSFYSRNTLNLNQDYLYLTVRSIIEKCGDYFHVCLINDNSFYKLLPNWSLLNNKCENLAFFADPVRENMRNLGLAQLLYKYGGLIVPSSFVVNRCFSDVYNSLDENTLLVGELANTSNQKSEYYPNSKVLGCKPNCSVISEYISYLENLYLNNLTSSIEFNDLTNDWFINNNKVKLIPAYLLGAQDKYGDIVNIDRLLNNSFINLDDNRYGLYIPADELIKRTKYNWFVYLNIPEILESNTQISKYILISQ